MNISPTYSTAGPADISGLFEKEFHRKAESCFLLKRGFHDTYQLVSAEEKIIVKIYRSNFPEGLLESQLNVASLLNHQHISISGPVNHIKGDKFFTLQFPEGKRNLVFYNYAEGERVRVPGEDHSGLLGRSLAFLHEASKPLAADFPQKINLETISGELKVILGNRLDKEEIIFLESLVNEAFANIPEIDPVICHGDIQPENFHFTANKVTFFDLDFCGSSNPLFDLGSFYWYDHQSRTKAIMKKFISGYSEVKNLSAEEIISITWFSLVKAIHHMLRVADFLDGKSSPLWQSADIRLFIRKLKKWHEEKCGKNIIA